MTHGKHGIYLAASRVRTHGAAPLSHAQQLERELVELDRRIAMAKRLARQQGVEV